MKNPGTYVTVAILLLFLQISCSNPQGKPVKTDSTSLTQLQIPKQTVDTTTDNFDDREYPRYDIDSETYNRLTWVDSVAHKYIKYSDNKLIVSTRGQGIVDECLLDRMEGRDSGLYVVCQIGHDYADEVGKRFTTDSWLYIDTATRQVWEYDLPSNRIKKWKK
jgi:hypothetical protein